MNAFLSFLATLLADELRSWLPWIRERMVQCSVSILPKDQQERYQEEWNSHLNQIPGELGKTLVALDFVRAAYVISRPCLANEIRDRLAALALLVALSPLLAYLAVWTKRRADGESAIFGYPGHVKGRPVRIYSFRIVGPQATDFSPYATLHWFGRMTPMTEPELKRLNHLMVNRYRGWKWLIKVHVLVKMAQLPRLINILRGDIPLSALFALFPASTNDDSPVRQL